MQTLIDLSKPPVPDPAWLSGFIRYFRLYEPSVTLVEAFENALLAHRSAWLLEPSEAAELWDCALRTRGWVPCVDERTGGAWL